MFEGLDDIDWEAFGESHIQVGTETKEIPTHVRNLLHEDEEEREYAVQSLFGEGQHFGMLGEATPFIVPFVLEVVADSEYEETDYLVHGLVSLCHHSFRTKSIKHVRLSLNIYDEIVKGFSIYCRVLDHEEVLTRGFAAELLGYMQDHASEAVQVLFKRLNLEPNSDVRTEIIRSMLKLIDIVLSPYTDEGKTAIWSLYQYLIDNGSEKEQMEFARGFGFDFSRIHFFPDEDIRRFVYQKMWNRLR